MRNIVGILALLACISASGVTQINAAGQAPPSENHDVWVAQAIQRMQTIKPGMSRGDLLKVFTTEGGLFTPLQRTYVSRDCAYFKVDVEFRPVGRPDRDSDGRVTRVESDQDIITKISKPYLAYMVMD